MKKACLLCAHIVVKHKHILCTSCHASYKQYMQTQWFQELLRLQRVQDNIDAREYGMIFTTYQTDLAGVVKSDTMFGKPVGRPGLLSAKHIDAVLAIYDAEPTLSLRAIARRLNNTVKFLTVRTILKKYRGATYPSIKCL